MNDQGIIKKFINWTENTKNGKIASKAFKWIFNGLIIYYLLTEILEIGFAETLKSLPTNGWFYILFTILYLGLPVSEYFVYSKIWPIEFWDTIVNFVLKKIYNNSLIGYSGDIYLGLHIAKITNIEVNKALSDVKDVAILSSISSTIFAIFILVVFLFIGKVPEHIINRSYLAYAIGVFIIIMFIVLMLPKKFRSVLFSLNGKQSIYIITVNNFRLLLLSIIQILQWKSVLPNVELTVWISYIALQIITTRIPLIPNRDLIFLAMGFELAKVLDISLASLTAMLIINNLLDKIINLATFLVIKLKNSKK